jgi:L-malate glycosyltransferase
MVSVTPAAAVFHDRTMKGLKVRLYYFLDALIMATMDAVICVSESQRRSLGRLLPERKIHFIPNAVDIDEISRLSHESITGVPDLHKRKKWIIFVGRLSREKGVAHLIRAFSRLISLHEQVTLIIIGDGPDRAKLESLTDSLRMTDCVHFMGFQTNVYPYIRNAEFLILPSLTEGMPVVILEAFALEKAVVATRVGGIPGVVQNAKHGLLVEARNESELGNAIARLINEVDLTKRMGTSAYDLEKMEYSFSIQAMRYQSLYRKVLV